MADRGDGGTHGRMTALPAALLGLLLAAPVAWAGAGSGSSNYSDDGGGSFSSGGGGGGSTFSPPSYTGGGSSGGSGGGGEPLPAWMIVAFVAVALLFFFVFPAVDVAGKRLRLSVLARLRHRRGQRAKAQRAKHLERTELAAAEAAAEDPAFDSDTLRRQAADLFLAVQGAWDRRDLEALGRLVAPALLTEWKKRLDDFAAKGWHNRVHVLEPPDVELVRIHNAAQDAEDRVVVHVSARTEDYVQALGGRRIRRDGATSDEVRIDEYWHLARMADGWRLESIEQEAEGAYNLTAENVATPWGDEERLRDEAIAEGAAAAASDAAPAELADLDFAGPARAQAMDLALADGRFDPDLIEASVRRTIAAWTQAVDGADDALAAVARPAAIDALLYPDDPTRTTRLVVRGPRILAVRITRIDAQAAPPYLWVQVDVRGRYYLENRDTQAVASGSRDREVTMTERWTLTLDGDGQWPWRLAAVGALSPA